MFFFFFFWSKWLQLFHLFSVGSMVTLILCWDTCSKSFDRVVYGSYFHVIESFSFISIFEPDIAGWIYIAGDHQKYAGDCFVTHIPC